ncbi:PepSY domain-containing protein [Psychromonas aquimarina]|uniref:PepSY domain-containing protein n=1 Tax=Psychromonas aquimarina TaxID=444919 RepID=UPI0003FD9F5F|nr:PepSY domain-containing protein [Psychromonas aquimarina]
MKFIKRIAISSALVLTSFTAAADNDGLSELALKRANFSIEEAVEKVTDSFPGKITELKLDDYNHQAVFEIEVINEKEGIEHKLKFSTADGKLLKDERESLSIASFSKLDDKDRVMLSQLDTSKFDLQASINKIQKDYGSSVVELELENKKGITFYEVELLNDNELIIDVVSGEIIPIKRNYHGS